VTIYIAYYPERLPPEISVLLQIQPTPAFSFESLDFLYMDAYSQPGNNVYYTVKRGVETAALKIVCVNSSVPCGPRSKLDFTHFVWSTFAYYCTNYAMVVLPSKNLRR
jgi:hypothetical protein